MADTLEDKIEWLWEYGVESPTARQYFQNVVDALQAASQSQLTAKEWSEDELAKLMVDTLSDYKLLHGYLSDYAAIKLVRALAKNNLIQAASQSKAAWMTIESAEKYTGVPIVVCSYYDGRQYANVASFKDGRWRGIGEESYIVNPTHWQPLPAAPKADAKEGG
jgi:hypothetical protein